MFGEDLIKAIEDNNLEEHKVKSLRVYVEIKGIEDQSTNVLLDEVYVWAHYDSIVAVKEPPTQPYQLLEARLIGGNSRKLSSITA